MTIRLRAHHLLCVLTFKGKGYSPAFVGNYQQIVTRLNQGEPVALVEGPDDICKPMLDDRHAHCRTSRVTRRDADALKWVLSVCPELPGSTPMLVLDRDRVARLREAFARQPRRQPCLGCEWADLCNAVAGTGFLDAELYPAVAPQGET